jgi:LmbE family N-acetylglucosaminyl deacetylase
MVVTAHPDDPEFLAGGTVARLAREGREVTYVIVTNGNKGSSDRAITSQHLVPIRQEEQLRAARVLGVERVEFLGYEGMPRLTAKRPHYREGERGWEPKGRS